MQNESKHLKIQLNFVMRSYLRLRYIQRIYVIVFIVTCVCLTMLYLLVRHRRSVLMPHLNDDLENYIDLPKMKPPLPAAFLQGANPSNTSYCQWKYGLPNHLQYKYTDVSYTPELGERGMYRVLYNVMEAKGVSKEKSNGTTPLSVTYCTHLTPHFVYHLAELAWHWEGQISVALFVPYTDVDPAVRMLNQLCYCLQAMNRISLHFVFPKSRPPKFQPGHRKLDVMNCNTVDVSRLRTYREKESLPYPVNVCRNAARVAAKTSHVLVSDVELLPSLHLHSRFIEMLKSVRKLRFNSRHIFVLPIFEVEAYVRDVPRTKDHLKQLYDEEKAVYFHRYICSHCQKFPGLVKWLKTPARKVIRPFLTVKREYPFHRWEPIYIGTHKDPLYSETLSWEGRQEKMTQMVEMCLLDYNLVILDGAFLVHWPGIKKNITFRTRQFRGKKKQHQNSKQYDFVINNLASKYIENEKCRL